MQTLLKKKQTDSVLQSSVYFILKCFGNHKWCQYQSWLMGQYVWADLCVGRMPRLSLTQLFWHKVTKMSCRRVTPVYTLPFVSKLLQRWKHVNPQKITLQSKSWIGRFLLCWYLYVWFGFINRVCIILPKLIKLWLVSP